jgi:excisionase family DNA binding protein
MSQTYEPARTEPLLRKRDVVGLLGISLRTLDRLIAAGEIEAIRVGGQLRFEQVALAAFVERHRERAGARPV